MICIKHMNFSFNSSTKKRSHFSECVNCETGTVWKFKLFQCNENRRKKFLRNRKSKKSSQVKIVQNAWMHMESPIFTSSPNRLCNSRSKVKINGDNVLNNQTIKSNKIFGFNFSLKITCHFGFQ